MDDIFDSLIYIVITLVAFVISALGKKKKKARPKITPVNEEPREQKKEKPLFSNLEKLLNEELGFEETHYANEYEEQEQVDQPIEEEKYETEQTAKDEVPIDHVPPEMLDDKEDIPYSIEYDDTSEIFSKSIQDAEPEDERQEELSDFNLRDAIIYSEIINRKEY
ncbi:MAG: hypothetical protein KQH79_00245 [Bacteroidetes bacterium]|nr:hypothetical protein [Bacteroidota bacterium]